MRTLNTQEVIKNKKRLKVLQAYNQETYELNDNEENVYLYHKPQFAQFAKDL